MTEQRYGLRAAVFKLKCAWLLYKGFEINNKAQSIYLSVVSYEFSYEISYQKF